MRHWIGCVMMAAVVAIAGCDGASRAFASLEELGAVQRAVVKATGHRATRVNLTNDRLLTVLMTNSPLAALATAARREKALAIARVAFEAYPPRASLESVTVVFVKYKVSFFVFTYTDATDVFSFTPTDLAPPPPTS